MCGVQGSSEALTRSRAGPGQGGPGCGHQAPDADAAAFAPDSASWAGPPACWTRAVCPAQAVREQPVALRAHRSQACVGAAELT